MPGGIMMYCSRKPKAEQGLKPGLRTGGAGGSWMIVMSDQSPNSLIIPWINTASSGIRFRIWNPTR